MKDEPARAARFLWRPPGARPPASLPKRQREFPGRLGRNHSPFACAAMPLALIGILFLPEPARRRLEDISEAHCP